MLLFYYILYIYVTYKQIRVNISHIIVIDHQIVPIEEGRINLIAVILADNNHFKQFILTIIREKRKI